MGGGRITADASVNTAGAVTEAEPGPPPAQTPEPSWALLGALAVAVGTFWQQVWRRVVSRWSAAGIPSAAFRTGRSVS